MARRAKERVYAEHPRATSSEQLCQCEMGGIVVSLENLQTFSWIKSKVAEGKLNLHGWYFDIESGEMLTYNLLSSEFERLN